jgi:hypothetical protein
MRYVEKYGTTGQATDDNVIRRMRFTCWIAKATQHTQTHTHSECVILLIAFPTAKRLRKRASLLRYTYPASLAKNQQSLSWKEILDFCNTNSISCTFWVLFYTSGIQAVCQGSVGEFP